jgi:hypothetical protein
MNMNNDDPVATVKLTFDTSSEMQALMQVGFFFLVTASVHTILNIADLVYTKVSDAYTNRMTYERV